MSILDWSVRVGLVAVLCVAGPSIGICASAPHIYRGEAFEVFVTDEHGALKLVVGSPGGSDIIGYVARATIGVLGWGLAPPQAIHLGNATPRFGEVQAETDRWPAGVADGLRARGWRFVPPEGGSGLHAIQVTPSGLVGGADPRGEGTVGSLPAQSEH